MFKNKLDFWYLLTIFLMCAFAALYYQVAWQYPVVDGFPLAERLIDPGFNPNDFYTNTFSDYSPRKYIANLYVFGADLFQVHYTRFISIANIGRIFITFMALYFLYLGLTNNKKIALIALYISSLSYLFVPKMPAWWPVVFDMTGAGVTEMFLMVAWALILFNRLFMAYIAIALALLFHPLAGIYGFIIGLFLLYSQLGIDGILNILKKPVTYLGGALMATGFLVNYIPYLKAVNGFKLNDEKFIDIIVNYKHPHHYLPSHFEIEVWASFILFTLFFIYAWKQVKGVFYNKRISPLIFLYAVSMMLIGWLFTEVYPTRLAASLIPYRGFPILIPIFIMVVSTFIYSKIKREMYLSALILFLPFLPYNSVGLTWFLFPNQHNLMLPSVILIIVFTAVYIFDRSPVYFSKINMAISTLFDDKFFYKTLAATSIIFVLFALSKFDITVPSLNNSPEIYKWLNKNTTDKDVIVTELNAANNQIIRLVSRRAVVASKDFPFLEKYYQEWYERYSTVYIEQQKARGHIDSLSYQELDKLLDQYQATILLRTKKLSPNDAFELLAKVDGESSIVFVYKNISFIR